MGYNFQIILYFCPCRLNLSCKHSEPGGIGGEITQCLFVSAPCDNYEISKKNHVKTKNREILLFCQPGVTVTSFFVYKVISHLESIDHLCINPIHRIGLIHK